MPEQRTHWRKIIESDYLAGADLDDGNGNHTDIIVTIKEAKKEMVREQGTNKEEGCLILKFREAERKPMICNVTNAKTISKVLKSEYIEDWTNGRIIIGTEKVKAFGELWDALRVRSRQAPAVAGTQPAVIYCIDCRNIIGEHQGVSAAKLAKATTDKYGRPLCYDCAQNAKARLEPTIDKEAEQVGIDEGKLPFDM
jgi:hypothetical protein